MVPAGAAVAACWPCCSCDVTGSLRGSTFARVPPDRRCPRGLGSGNESGSGSGNESGSVTSSARPNSGGGCGSDCACCRDRDLGSFLGCHGRLFHFYCCCHRRRRRLRFLGGSVGHRRCILRMLRSSSSFAWKAWKCEATCSHALCFTLGKFSAFPTYF